MVELPQFDRLVSGDDYHRPAAPETDALDTSSASGNQRIPNVPQGQPSPLEAMSIASSQHAAAPLGAFLTSNRHETNWLDPTTPHVSPEPQPKI